MNSQYQEKGKRKYIDQIREYEYERINSHTSKAIHLLPLVALSNLRRWAQAQAQALSTRLFSPYTRNC